MTRLWVGFCGEGAHDHDGLKSEPFSFVTGSLREWGLLLSKHETLFHLQLLHSTGLYFPVSSLMIGSNQEPTRWGWFAVAWRREENGHCGLATCVVLWTAVLVFMPARDWWSLSWPGMYPRAPAPLQMRVLSLSAPPLSFLKTPCRAGMVRICLHFFPRKLWKIWSS
jgi:hypothetical protein